MGSSRICIIHLAHLETIDIRMKDTSVDVVVEKEGNERQRKNEKKEKNQ
jgi:hypothetical protein